MARPAQKKKTAPSSRFLSKKIYRYLLYAGLTGSGLVLLLIAGIF